MIIVKQYYITVKNVDNVKSQLLGESSSPATDVRLSNVCKNFEFEEELKKATEKYNKTID